MDSTCNKEYLCFIIMNCKLLIWFRILIYRVIINFPFSHTQSSSHTHKVHFTHTHKVPFTHTHKVPFTHTHKVPFSHTHKVPFTHTHKVPFTHTHKVPRTHTQFYKSFYSELEKIKKNWMWLGTNQHHSLV